ncbi:TetR/AcrR family transcriptional regulator [Actinomadura decatromicini]|uniref:TetR/AcrR family transcriptional regulator n=1 Tax=Actinomadura decatromicini TaxID=2604572 RepID=A0A5D3FLY2_9ACTN|nr:TetR/AcrR family transcriptional regulator [Actinomadura decatromicini]
MREDVAVTGRRATPTGRYGGRTAAERRAERRRRFLGAGLEMFGRGPGYRGTTVAALSEAAGLSTRQFYEEFRTLEDLLAELHREINDAAERAVVDALPGVAGLRLAERTARLFRVYAASVAADPARVRVAFVEIVGAGPRLDRQRRDRRARWVEFIRAEAAGAAARGEIPARDHRIAATAFLGGVNGLLHDWSAGWLDASLDEMIDELVHMLLGALNAPGPTP